MTFAFRTKPFEHQVEAVETMVRYIDDGVPIANFSEQGTGKSKVLIDLVDHYTDVRERQLRVLVVCPNILIDNWVKEVRIHSRHYAESGVYALRGPAKKRYAIAEEGDGIFVINYEGVRALRKKFNLAMLPWDFVIADEATAMNHRTSLQSQAMHDFNYQDCVRIPATGTPVTNSPLGIWSIFKFMDPKVFGCTFTEFRARFAEVKLQKYGAGPTFEQVVGYKNLDQLRDIQAAHSVRHLKAECLDLPEKTFVTLGLEMAEDQAKAYKEMAEEMITLAENEVVTASGVLDKLLKLRQVCQGWMYTEEGEVVRLEKSPTKLEALRGIVGEASRPLLVFYTFTEDGNILEEAMKKDGTPYIRIDGSVKNEERAERIDAFNTGKIPVALLQLAVTKFGLTLTVADTAVYYGNDWSLEARLQSQDRIHRIGQAEKVTYYDLVMKETVDESILRMLQEKKTVADRVTGDEMRKLLEGAV